MLAPFNGAIHITSLSMKMDRKKNRIDIKLEMWYLLIEHMFDTSEVYIMSKCKLSEFKKYCLRTIPEEYHVRVAYCLNFRFDSVEISFIPDAICFEDEHGNCLNIHGIKEIKHEADDYFVVYSDYFGKRVIIEIMCVHSTNLH